MKKNHNNKKIKRSKSILHIKNSRSKSIKYVKKGRKGKDCKYFNDVKLCCNKYNSGYYHKFCQSDYCLSFKSKDIGKNH